MRAFCAGHFAPGIKPQGRLQLFFKAQLARLVVGRFHVGNITGNNILPLQLHIHDLANKADLHIE